MFLISQQIIRGTEQKLLEQLTEDTPAIAGEPVHNSVINDPSYVEDFLLTHRTFISSSQVMDHLLKLMYNAKTMDTAKQRVTRVLLLWVSTIAPKRIRYSPWWPEKISKILGGPILGKYRLLNLLYLIILMLLGT